MTVGKKLMLSAAALFVSSVGVALSSLYSLGSVNRELEKSTGITARTLALTGNIKAGANGMRTGQRGILLNALQHDSKGIATTRKDYAARHQAVLDLIAELKPLLVLDQSKALTGALENYVAAHANYFNQIVDLCAADKIPEAATLYKESGAPAGVNMEKTATELMKNQIELMALSASEGQKKATSARWIDIVASLISLALVGVVYLIERDVTSRLRSVASNLALGAEQIDAATGQLSRASQALAQGATEQAASIEETSAGTQEVASLVRDSARGFKSAADLMGTVDERAGQATGALDEMLASMQAITLASDRISKIIKVIDEIAFQTNILALNAAVEAARAGEAGMGFAVVADEVRNLAQRSAQAAKNTAALIEDSMSTSNDGGVKLQHATEVIRTVIEGLRKAKALVDSLKIGREQEDTGVAEIAKAIESMEKVTQNNAATAEQTASASAQMQAQAHALRGIVGDLQAMAGG